MTTNYERGRAFEYRTRDKLYERGAVYVARSAGSHTKVDLVAFFPSVDSPSGPSRTRVWLVQCKRDGRLPAAEREALVNIARATGVEAILAKRGEKRGTIEFEFLYP